MSLIQRLFARLTAASLVAVLVTALSSIAPLAAANADDVTIFAAASLKDALDDVGPAWHEATGHNAVVSLGASSALAKQIEAGAPADIFISATPEWMEALAGKGLLREGTRRDFLSNTLVLVAHGGAAPAVAIGPGFDLSAMLGDQKLAMALVDSVPAGVYGKAALTSLGIWDSVAPKVAQSDNVRAALALVSAGEAPFGIVYATDAVADPNVRVVATFPRDSHPPIIYPAAVTAEATSPVAQAFLDYVTTSPVAQAAFERQGFGIIE